MKIAVVSLHDLSPATESALDSMLEVGGGIPCSLLVVPGPWRGRSLEESPSFASRIRTLVATGHEAVVHGWEHRGPEGVPASLALMLGRVLARGCEEFWAADEEEARWKLELGRRAFTRVGLAPRGFVAPGWLTSPETVHALASAGFDYVAGHLALVDLVRRRRFFMPVVSQRPGGGSQAACARMSRWFVDSASTVGLPVRIAVHPDDVRHDECVDSVRRSIEVLRNRGYEFTTYGDLIARLRGSAAEFPQARLRSAS